MATIRPFRGLRYDLPSAGDPAELLAPPYDVVDEAGRAALAQRSANNCVHVILPEGDGDEKYGRGAREFAGLVERALTRDAEPSLYVYHQRFTAEGREYTRKGFICLIELTSFGAGPVLPHERTLSGPKEDRLKLMRACGAHLGTVFGMFSDPERRWEQAVSAQLGAPVLEARFDGSHHTLYRVADAAAVAAVQGVLEGRSVYIADGHHRYETMCSYRQDFERAGHGDDARFGMIYLSNLDDPGLVVPPTHRVIHDVQGLDPEGTIASLDHIFAVRREPIPTDAAALRALLKQAGAAGPAFALARPGADELAILTLRDDFDPDQAGLGGLPPALQRLDVVLLHELVLDRGFGITREAQAAKTNIRYYKSSAAALELARAPDVDAQVVCFMNATPVSDVVAVCDSGAVMPQKSTFFYPKIPTGLTFHSLDLER